MKCFLRMGCSSKGLHSDSSTICGVCKEGRTQMPLQQGGGGPLLASFGPLVSATTPESCKSVREPRQRCPHRVA